MRHRFLLGCLVLSGFAGLAYELLWVRLLALSFGSTAASFSTVLAVFFGGLAIGSFIGGRIARRSARPVRAYALIELGTGVAALVLYPILVSLETTFGRFDPGPGALGTAVRFVVASLVLIVPTVLMGATLPFVTRAMVERDEDVGRVTALIYAFNTLGACLGAYTTTFWSLPYLGVFWSTLLTVGINAVVFALATVLGRGERGAAREGESRPAAAEDEEDGKVKLVGGTLAAVLGFAAVALQVVWVRIFATAMEGTTYGTGSVLIAVLVGIGVGSLGLAPFLKRSRWAGLGFVALQVTGLGLVLLLFWLLPWITYEIGALQMQRLGTFGLHLQMLIVTLAVLGPSVCSGASLPLIIGIVERRAVNSARTVGTLYASNTMGAIAGSLVTGFIVLPSAGSEAAVLLAVIGLAAAAAFGALFLVEQARPLRLALVPVGLLLAAVYQGYDVQALTSGPAAGSFADWRRLATRTKEATVLFSEAKSSTIRVTDAGGARSLTLNALGQGGRQDMPPHHVRESLLMAAVPLAHAVGHRRALLVGLGAGVTVDAMLEMGVDHVRVVELEPKVVDAVNVIFREDNPLESERVDVVINDARHFLNVQRSRGAERYDIISSMPAHPWVASPIFTQDFFRIVKDNLAERGIFCSWFGLGKMDSKTTDSLLRAFASVFDHYVVYYMPGNGAYYLVGSRSQIEVSPKRLREIFQHPIVRAHPPLDDPLFLPKRVVASSRGDGTVTLKPGRINTDDRPIVEMLSPTTTPTRARASDDLFSARGLDPALVPAGERIPFVRGVLEAMLGTPNGRMPVEPTRPNVEAAKAMLERADAHLDDDVRAYFDLRLAIARGPSDPGLPPRIDALAPRELRLRARRARAALLEPNTPERADALSALPPEPGVVIRQLSEVGPAALARVPPREPELESAPVAWWLWFLAHRRTLDDETRGRLMTTVGPELVKTGNETLFSLTASVARASGATTVERIASDWASSARRARATYHRRKGIQAGRQRRFADAARHLWQAFQLVPLARNVHMPLVQSLVEIHDTRRLNSVSDALRFQGMSEAQVGFLVQEARRRQQAGESFEKTEPEPEAPSPPMDLPAPGANPQRTGT